MASENISVDIVPDLSGQAKERRLELIAKSTVTLRYYSRSRASLILL